MSSPHLQWLITRKNSSFILKKRNVKQPFSTVRNRQTSLPTIFTRWNIIVMLSPRSLKLLLTNLESWMNLNSNLFLNEISVLAAMLMVYLCCLQEPLHLTNRHCYKYNTLVHKNVIGVEPAKDKNGFVVAMKSKTKVVCIVPFTLPFVCVVHDDFYLSPRSLKLMLITLKSWC